MQLLSVDPVEHFKLIIEFPAIKQWMKFHPDSSKVPLSVWKTSRFSSLNPATKNKEEEKGEKKSGNKKLKKLYRWDYLYNFVCHGGY